jgi:hypothetical protein
LKNVEAEAVHGNVISGDAIILGHFQPGDISGKLKGLGGHCGGEEFLSSW